MSTRFSYLHSSAPQSNMKTWSISAAISLSSILLMPDLIPLLSSTINMLLALQHTHLASCTAFPSHILSSLLICVLCSQSNHCWSKHFAWYIHICIRFTLKNSWHPQWQHQTYDIALCSRYLSCHIGTEDPGAYLLCILTIFFFFSPSTLINYTAQQTSRTANANTPCSSKHLWRWQFHVHKWHLQRLETNRRVQQRLAWPEWKWRN